MKIKIDIKKKYAFIIVSAIIVLAGIFIVFALGAGQIPNPGHSTSQLGAPAGCTTGQVLQWNGNDWSCADAVAGGNGLIYLGSTSGGGGAGGEKCNLGETVMLLQDIDTPGGGTDCRIINQGIASVFVGSGGGNCKWACFKQASGAGGGVEVAQAYRVDGPNSDTGSQAVARPITMLQGPSSAIVAVNNVNPGVPGVPMTNLDGLKCNDAEGWKLTGCYEAQGTDAQDIIPILNGCVTNDYDTYYPAGMSGMGDGIVITISCIR